MKIEGSVEVGDVDRLWALLSSPTDSARCIPGLEGFSVEGGEIRARAKVGIGFMKGTFNITVQVLENDPSSRRARLKLSGSGNLGNFSADVDVRADESEGKKAIAYSAEAQVSGLLGTVASGILKKRVEELVNDFIRCAEGGPQAQQGRP